MSDDSHLSLCSGGRPRPPGECGAGERRELGELSGDDFIITSDQSEASVVNLDQSGGGEREGVGEQPGGAGEEQARAGGDQERADQVRDFLGEQRARGGEPGHWDKCGQIVMIHDKKDDFRQSCI